MERKGRIQIQGCHQRNPDGGRYAGW